MQPRTISLKEYAAHRGVTIPAVKKAIRHDRLKKSVTCTPEGRYKIRSIEAADAEWALNTDPNKQRGVNAINAEQLAAVPVGLPDGANPEPAISETASKQKWSNMRERYAALREKAKYEQETGALVDRSEFEKIAAKVASEVKTKLLAVPSRAKQRIPLLMPADIAALEDLIREALETVANSDD